MAGKVRPFYNIAKTLSLERTAGLEQVGKRQFHSGETVSYLGLSISEKVQFIREGWDGK